jgi:hypothetical protein
MSVLAGDGHVGAQGVQSRDGAAAKLTGQPPCPRWPRRRTRGGAPRPPCWCACGACTRNGREALVGALGRISCSAQPGPPRKHAGGIDVKNVPHVAGVGPHACCDWSMWRLRCLRTQKPPASERNRRSRIPKHIRPNPDRHAKTPAVAASVGPLNRPYRSPFRFFARRSRSGPGFAACDSPRRCKRIALRARPC